MKKFLRLICVMMLVIALVGCDKNTNDDVEEKEEKKETTTDIVELYYNYAKEFKEEKNMDIYATFADVDSNGTIEMLFGYKENDENYATVVYLNEDNEVVNPGFLKGVNLASHYLMNFDYKFNWFLFSGNLNNTDDDTFYSCIDLMNPEIGAEKIKPISIAEIRKNYSFSQSYAYISLVNELTLDQFKTMYDSILNLEEFIGEEQITYLKGTIDKKRKAKEEGTASTTFKVGDYNVKFGKYKWVYPDNSGASYYTLNSDYTCVYEAPDKKENCTFSVGVATDGQDISTAEERPSINIKHKDYTMSYFPTSKGFRDTDLENFEYVGE